MFEKLFSRSKDKAFYRMFFSLYIALVLQNVITISVNLADNIMLGAYSESALSGVASVNQIQFVYQMVLVAFGDGLVMICSQYWGMQKPEPMKRVISIIMKIAIAVSILLFVLISLFPYQAMHIFTNEVSIVEEGVKYLNIIRFSYLFFAITQILLATCRTVEKVKIALYVSIMTLIVNFCINYTLIFGHFGAPEMGARGAAIGTLVARIIETIMVVVYIMKNNPLGIRLADFGTLDRQLLKDVRKVVLPLLMIQGLWGVNTALQTVILGHMTPAAIAANSVSSNLYLMMKSAAIGAAASAGVIIGKTIGEGDYEKVQRYAVRLQKLFVVVGIVCAILLFFIRIPVLKLYNLSPETMEMSNSFLLVMCVICLGVSYQMPTGSGIIKGGGNTKFVMCVDLVSIWCIVIPLSLIMAFVVKANPVIVVICLNADQMFKCIPAYIGVNHTNWIRKLTH